MSKRERSFFVWEKYGLNGRENNKFIVWRWGERRAKLKDRGNDEGRVTIR